MISAIGLKKKELEEYQLFVIRGQDFLLRDRVLSLLGDFIKVVDASQTLTSDIVGQIQSKSVSMQKGAVLVKCAECLGENVKFDVWLHDKEKKESVVFVVSAGQKLDPHYSRVVGRRGLIIDCNLPVGNPKIMVRWVAEQAAHRGVRLTPYLAVSLANRCSDLMMVDRELDKLKYGRKGTITKRLLDELIVDRGGGVPLIIEALADGNKECTKLIARCFGWGMSVNQLLGLLSGGILMRLRLRESGPNAKRAAQELGFDQRFAYDYYEQARKLGVERMWEMINQLAQIHRAGSLSVVDLIRWAGSQVEKGRKVAEAF